MVYLDVNKLNSDIYKERRWMKYYDYDEQSFQYPKETIFGYLLENNLNNLDNYSINYFGNRLTYGQLFRKIDECFVALINQGVKKGDIVSICMPTTPESIIAYYAVNKLGAVSNFIDVRKDADDIVAYINEGKSKLLLILDTALDKIINVIDNTSLNKVVCISPFETFNPFVKRTLQFLSNQQVSIPNDSGYINWENFIRNGQQCLEFELPMIDTFESKKMALLLHTSGSSGVPKTVALSNEAVNDRVYQYMYNGMKHAVGDVYLDIIPLFIAFGAVVGVQLPLCMGMEDVIIPAFSQNDIYKYFKKYRPNHLTFTPKSYNYMLNNSKFRKYDFGHVQTMASGGDGMNFNENSKYDSRLHQNGFLYNISSGYGGTEIGAPFCTERSGLHKYGSNGIPLPGNNILIFKHGTYEPLSYNQVGDICMVVDNAMLGYYNNLELTDRTMIQLSDGKTGILLGDCGYIDEDGFIYIKGRYEDVIKDTNGSDIWPIDIENYIYLLSFVKMCVMVQSADKVNRLYVVFNDDISLSNEQKISIIERELYTNFPNIDIDIVVENDLPLTSSGKLDRRNIKKRKK